MISVKEAIQTVLENSQLLDSTERKVMDSLGYFLAKDILSTVSLPYYDQSAMDGYAISGVHSVYEVIDEVKAGDSRVLEIKSGECVRIFTGAMIPKGATAIAKQEIVSRKDNSIELQENVSEGTSIRKKGEEIEKNDLVVQKGTLISPSVIGVLSAIGMDKVDVFKQPNVSVIVTGNELVKPGNELKNGQIYESNSFTLKASLNAIGIEPTLESVVDDFEKTKDCIKNAINRSDVVILTGGISVGDYDFVGKALEDLDVNQLFYKVKQKPGKPLYFGERNGVTVFALPGNPSAVLTCYYMYVLPSILKMIGSLEPSLSKRTCVLQHDFVKKGDRTHLLRALEIKGEVSVLEKQSSAMLSSFIEANCLLQVSGETEKVNKGEEVEVFMLP